MQIDGFLMRRIICFVVNCSSQQLSDKLLQSIGYFDPCQKLTKTSFLGTIRFSFLFHYKNLPMQYTEIFSVVKKVKISVEMFLCFYAQNIESGHMLERF